MEQSVNILAIGAHPDDIEYGCGGSLLKYAQTGHRVYLYVATHGSVGGAGDTRAREMEASAERLGAEELFWGGHTDTQIPLSQDLISEIEGIIGKVNPKFIFTHWRDDTHQDHRNLTACTLSATRYIPNFLFYEGPTSQGFTPNVYVDITGVLEEKTELLRIHASQMTKTHIEETSIIDMAMSNATFRGIQARVRHAEGFTSQRLLINI
ncbi:PIG-L deacetylase family protein [Gemmatimonadota bacterium]